MPLVLFQRYEYLPAGVRLLSGSHQADGEEQAGVLDVFPAISGGHQLQGAAAGLQSGYHQG